MPNTARIITGRDEYPVRIEFDNGPTVKLPVPGDDTFYVQVARICLYLATNGATHVVDPYFSNENTVNHSNYAYTLAEYCKLLWEHQSG